MALDLGSLAVGAAADEVPDVSSHPGPDESRRQETKSCSGSRMRETVEALEDGWAEAGWDDRSRSGRGDVTPELQVRTIRDWEVLKNQGGRLAQRGDLRVG